MNAKVSDLMVEGVITAFPNDTVGDARKLFDDKGIHALPIVDGDGELVGIVSTTDLSQVGDGSLPLSKVMSRKVHSVPPYSDISAAARTMRKYRIHHLLVINDGKLQGILSSFDLLKLVQDKRFAIKAAPTPKKKVRGGS